MQQKMCSQNLALNDNWFLLRYLVHHQLLSFIHEASKHMLHTVCVSVHYAFSIVQRYITIKSVY